MTTFVE